MAKAEIFAGDCGFNTTVETRMNSRSCTVQINSECNAIQEMAGELQEVNPYEEISFKRKMPRTHEMGVKYCTHAACPVPSGIIKAIEVEAGLALPTDVTIKLSKTPKE
jgi:hypothetical protein